MFSKTRFPYFILGIGIGILLTSTLYILNPVIEYRDYSEEEIIEIASDLGMVFIKENINSSTKKNEKEQEQKKINLIVEQGDSLKKVSQKLYDLGIIDNEEKFHNYAIQKGVEKKIRVGTYVLTKGLSYDNILNILTKQAR